jgi:hypothetical protein
MAGNYIRGRPHFHPAGAVRPKQKSVRRVSANDLSGKGRLAKKKQEWADIPQKERISRPAAEWKAGSKDEKQAGDGDLNREI